MLMHRGIIVLMTPISLVGAHIVQEPASLFQSAAKDVYSKLSTEEIDFIKGVGPLFTVHWFACKKRDDIMMELRKRNSIDSAAKLVKSRKFKIVWLDEFGINVVSGLLYQLINKKYVNFEEAIDLAVKYDRLGNFK